jgi:hypothetical protein
MQIVRTTSHDDDVPPVATWKTGQPRHVCIKEQGKAKRKGNVKPDIAYQKTLKSVDNSALRSQTNTQPMAKEEALCRTARLDTREPGCEQTKKDDQGRLHPSP